MSGAYKSIFKSSIITGGSQIIVLILQMIRAKALAVLLGPGGTGIIGLYGSTTGLVNSLSNIGLSGSAVRHIAKDNASDNKDAISKTVFVYRVLIFGTSLIAAMVMILFAPSISNLTFGTTQYTNGIRWMSLVVLFHGISTGQYTLLQGLRRIKDLALAKVIGTLIGVIAGILFIYFLKIDGIIPYLVSGAVFAIAISWYFASKVEIKASWVDFQTFKTISGSLLAMGLAFMTAGLVTSISGYVSRVLITDRFSVDELGLYTASWTLSAIYVNFVLSAMGADFYPRLTAIIDDHSKAKKLINEQTIMGVTLSMAGIVAVIGFAPFILQMFYSEKFVPATEMLQWMTAGMAIKVVSWPIGYIIVCKGKKLLFTFTEIFWALLYIPFLLLFTKIAGLQGAGIAFFSAYFLHTIVIIIAGRKLIGFRWSDKALLVLIVFILAVFFVFLISRFLFGSYQIILVSIIIMTLIFLTFYLLSKMLGINVTKLLAEKLNLKK